MKKPVFSNYGRGRMLVKTGHGLFDKQTSLITTGNVLSPTQQSSYVRGKYVVSCNGKHDYEPGRLRDFDLKQFSHMPWRVREQLVELTDPMSDSIIVYQFHHYSNHHRIVHGYIATTSTHDFIKMWVVGRGYKSINVLYECRKYICNGFDDEENKGQNIDVSV